MAKKIPLYQLFLLHGNAELRQTQKKCPVECRLQKQLFEGRAQNSLHSSWGIISDVSFSTTRDIYSLALPIFIASPLFYFLDVSYFAPPCALISESGFISGHTKLEVKKIVCLLYCKIMACIGFCNCKRMIAFLG